MTVLVLPGTVSDSSALVLLYCLCKSHQRSLVSATPVYGESGCKGLLSIRSKLLRNFFQSFFGAGLRKSSFPKAGAKVGIIGGKTNGRKSFLEGKTDGLCKRLVYKPVVGDIFPEGKKWKEADIH